MIPEGKVNNCLLIIGGVLIIPCSLSWTLSVTEFNIVSADSLITLCLCWIKKTSWQTDLKPWLHVFLNIHCVWFERPCWEMWTCSDSFYIFRLWWMFFECCECFYSNNLTLIAPSHYQICEGWRWCSERSFVFLYYCCLSACLSLSAVPTVDSGIGGLGGIPKSKYVIWESRDNVKETDISLTDICSLFGGEILKCSYILLYTFI